MQECTSPRELELKGRGYMYFYRWFFWLWVMEKLGIYNQKNLAIETQSIVAIEEGRNHY